MDRNKIFSYDSPSKVLYDILSVCSKVLHDIIEVSVVRCCRILLKCL